MTKALLGVQTAATEKVSAMAGLRTSWKERPQELALRGHLRLLKGIQRALKGIRGELRVPLRDLHRRVPESFRNDVAATPR